MQHYLICGCGGIGSGLIETLLQQGQKVTCLSHRAQNLSGATCHQVDLTSPNAVDDLKNLWNKPEFDVIINAIGMLHNPQHCPEKSVQQITDSWLAENIKVNVLPSVHLSQALDASLTRQSSLKFIAISGRVSSMRDNHLGGWYSYRMAKAMLNMYLKNLSIEWQRKFPNIIVAGYHPGTVDTSLSKPFQQNVPAHKLFSPQQATHYCLEVVDNLSSADSGFLIDWQGKRIDF